MKLGRTAPVLIGLGSNLGDPRLQLEGAVRLLRADPDVIVTRVSPWYRTRPVGGPPGQADYLNGALAARTWLAPEGLLRRLHAIEVRFGRDRAREVRNGPRTLDLDLLFHGERMLDLPGLVLPHPRLEERAFVLVPLADVAPDKRLPRCGLTVREQLEHIDAADVLEVAG